MVQRLRFANNRTRSAGPAYSQLIRYTIWVIKLDRPRRWSIFQSDGMINVFFQASIDFNGFSMVLTTLDHHH